VQDPVLLILFFAIARGLSTQSPGGGGKKPSTTGSTPTNPTNPKTSPNLQPTDTMPRSHSTMERFAHLDC
jgi:hypothetical protein